MLQFLYALGVALIPMNGVKGIGALGEQAHELSCYPFLLVIVGTLGAAALAGNNYENLHVSKGNGSPLYYIFGGVLLVMFLTILYNISDVATSNFHERSGLAKFAASTLVMFYGMGLAYSTYRLVPGRWQTMIILPTAISAIACLLYSTLEIAQQHGALSAVYAKINPIVHATNTDVVFKWNGKVNLKVISDWDTRIRSLCFEPPAFGLFTGFAWPWLLAGFMSNKGDQRRFYGIVLALFTFLIIIARARTGWVMLAVNLAVLAALRFIYLVPRPRTYNKGLAGGLIWACVALFVCGCTYYYFNFDHITQKVIRGTSVSNLSRLASQVAAVNMFRDHVLMGTGFGQYGFHVTKYMPNWGYLSYELRPWLIYPTAPWPSVYSIYARLVAETGVFGLTAWVGLWFYMSYLVVSRSRQYLEIHGKLPAVAYALVLSYFTVLVSGITTDTFRTPMLWISLGLGCAYLNGLDLKKKDTPAAHPTGEA
jgi:hypothetical protein